MTFNTPVLTDRVPYTWDELKSHAVDANFHQRVRQTQAPEPVSDAFTQKSAQGAGLKPLGEVNIRRAPVAKTVEPPAVKPSAVASAEPVQNTLASQQVEVTTPSAQPFVSDKLVGEIVEAVVPLIMERLHAQVSIMVDMTMKQAASKIRNDFDNALKTTVQSAVQKVVEEKLKK